MYLKRGRLLEEILAIIIIVNIEDPSRRSEHNP